MAKFTTETHNGQTVKVLTIDAAGELTIDAADLPPPASKPAQPPPAPPDVIVTLPDGLQLAGRVGDRLVVYPNGSVALVSAELFEAESAPAGAKIP